MPTWLALVVLSLACYRAQRIVTADEWPPSKAFREWLRRRALPQHSEPDGEGVVTETRSDAAFALYEFFTCPWCFGFWLSLAGTYLFDRYALDLTDSWAVLAAIGFAVAAVVGLLGSKD